MTSWRRRRCDPTARQRGLTAVLPRRFGPNVLTSYLSTVVSTVQVLVITPVIVHGLGAERYGIWSLVVSLGVFTILLDMGLTSGTTRYVAHYEELGERARVARAVTVSFWILLALGTLALLVGAMLALLFPHLFRVPAGEEESASVLVVLVSAATAITIVGGAFQGCLAGLMRYSALNLIRIVAVVAQATAFVVCIWLGGQLVALGLALLVVTLAEMIARYVAVRRLLPDLKLSRRFVDPGFASEIVKMSAWISSTQFATALRYRVDTIVVGLVVGVRAAGVYAVGQLLFVAAERFIRPITTGIFPLSAELAGRHDAEGLRVAVITGTRVSLAVAGPLCLAGILLAGPLVDAWIGPGIRGRTRGHRLPAVSASVGPGQPCGASSCCRAREASRRRPRFCGRRQSSTSRSAWSSACCSVSPGSHWQR